MGLQLLLTVHSFTRCFRKEVQAELRDPVDALTGCSGPGVWRGSSWGAEVAGRPGVQASPGGHSDRAGVSDSQRD